MEQNQKSNAKRCYKLQSLTYPIIIYVLLCVAIDILIRTRTLHCYWIVSDTYIDVVFAALCTVAVLGSAIQSIIIGSFNSKIYGLTLKEILAEMPNSFNATKTVIVSFVSIIIGIIPYAMGFCSTTTAITVSLTIIIANSSIQIWKLLSDKQEQKRIINEIIQSGNCASEFFYTRWFGELKCAIENNDEALQEEYIELIASIFNANNEQNKHNAFVEKNIMDAFPIAALRIGFVDAYKRIACLGEWNNESIDTFSVVRAYLDQIQYSDEQRIGSYHIPETVGDIIARMEIATEDKMWYIYWLYTSVKKNQIISYSVRRSIISNIIRKLSYLRDNEVGELCQKIILKIFRRDILENEDVNERKDLMQIINYQLYENNRYSDEICYTALLAQLFRALFFYSEYETETLKSDYRSELFKLFQYRRTGKDNFELSLAMLVNEKANSIVAWLTEDSKTDFIHRENALEYYSAEFNMKRVVWTAERCLVFAFSYYLLVGYQFPAFPIDETLKDESIDYYLRERLCICLEGCFDCEGQLTQDYKNALSRLRKFVGINCSFEDSLASPSFEVINQIKQEIGENHNAQLVSAASNDLKELNKRIIEKCSKFEGLVFSDKINLENAPVITIKPQIRYPVENDIAFAAEEKSWLLEEMLNRMLDNALPKVVLSFDQQGVNALLTKLENGDFKARTYTFINDLALNNEVRASEEYSRLAVLLKSIPLINRSQIHRNVFLREKEILFNAKVVAYRTESPTDEQCIEFIKSFKVAEGKYQIDNAIFDYQKAIAYVKRSLLVEYSEMRVATRINGNSGFIINFQY